MALLTARRRGASWCAARSRRAAPCAMGLCRAAVIAIALELVTQCALLEAQTTSFTTGGRQSYTQPESQGGVLTRTDDGPPYRDVNDAVRAAGPQTA